MGGTSNGPKIRNKISATFRHLNLPYQNAEKVVTPRRDGVVGMQITMFDYEK